MKKILNKAEDLVIEMCEGMIKAHPTQLAFNRKFKIISRAKVNKQKVSLISGGGSGHEPAHGGFVGTGMLDAAVCGDVFASPSTIQVFNAILETQSEKGTLLIVKNYSGDCTNFDAAAEMAACGRSEVEPSKAFRAASTDDIKKTAGNPAVFLLPETRRQSSLSAFLSPARRFCSLASNSDSQLPRMTILQSR